MSEATIRRTRCLRLSKRKMEVSGRRCSRKEMCRTSQLHHQDTRWQDIGEIETDCNLSNLKKHLLNNDVDDENQVNNEKLEIKSENQPSPKAAVRTTKPPRRYDEYESH